MSINAPRPQQPAGKMAPAPILTANPSVRRAEPVRAPSPAPKVLAEEPRKSAGYGLPCSKCHLYYSADLDHCPTCHNSERVSPVVPLKPLKVAQPAAELVPDTSVIEKEREEFLRQFKSQHLETRLEPELHESVCARTEHDEADDPQAEICKSCFERMQERVDICEAALHMDLKEASQIVYDAVWADPSDPGKTYENAADALLTELRKRAGLSSLLKPFRSCQH
ncbi:MAG TPA: hypothetical protein VMX38_24240 [Verrucomicrobiae bacterium]|jgi:hypothetical protein|nr:hypothetical protein [Verrucomicrobiae bacterium]